MSNLVIFGLEIRKRDNIRNLYKDVDTVLNKINDSTIAQDTVGHALQRMLTTENHFSICTIDKLSQMCNLIIPKERHQVYSSLHCMHWNEMLPDYRQKIIAMLFDDFRSVLNPDEIKMEDVQTE